METTLNLCKKNQEYIVSKINTSQPAIARRLSELGFYSGAVVKVVCFSALKKTLLVQLLGYTLSLRASVAQIVKVKKI